MVNRWSAQWEIYPSLSTVWNCQVSPWPGSLPWMLYPLTKINHFQKWKIWWCYCHSIMQLPWQASLTHQNVPFYGTDSSSQASQCVPPAVTAVQLNLPQKIKLCVTLIFLLNQWQTINYLLGSQIFISQLLLISLCQYSQNYSPCAKQALRAVRGQ